LDSENWKIDQTEWIRVDRAELNRTAPGATVSAAGFAHRLLALA
jgi:hypothetical protein